MVSKLLKRIADWWFCLQWQRRARTDKRAGRWPL